jgi:small subunit ribosomal protein S6
MARGYELLIVVQPDIPDEELQQLIEKAKRAIEGSKGEFLKARKWGKRRLVHKIKGQLKGYFLLIYFNGDVAALKQLDMLLRYNEQVLRYQAVKLDKNFDIESVPEGEAEQTEKRTEGKSESKAPTVKDAEERAAEEATPEEASEEVSTQ